MEIRPIKTEADYQATLKEIESLMMAEANSPEGDRVVFHPILTQGFHPKLTHPLVLQYS